MRTPRPGGRQPKAQTPSPARHPRARTVEPGDHVYVQHPEQGPLAMKVLACGRDGFTGECDKGRRHAIPFDRMLGHKSRVKLAMKVIDAGQEGAIVEDERGQRRFIAGDLAPSQEGAGGELTEDHKIRAAEGRRKDPLLDGLGKLGKALESGRPVFFTAPPGKIAPAIAANPRNQPGSADRRHSACHEAGHAVVTFALDRLLHMHGRPLRNGITDLEIHPHEGADGMIARTGSVNRRRDRMWNRDFAAGELVLPELVRDATLEAIELAAGVLAEARELAGSFEAARTSVPVRVFRECVLTGTAPAAQDEMKVAARLSFVARHSDRDHRAVLDDIIEAAWALLAAEWPALAAVARTLDRRDFLDGHTAMGIWAAARLPPAEREAAAETASPAGVRVLEDLLDAIGESPTPDGSP